MIYVNNMLELENQMMIDLADQRKLKHGHKARKKQKNCSHGNSDIEGNR